MSFVDARAPSLPEFHTFGPNEITTKSGLSSTVTKHIEMHRESWAQYPLVDAQGSLSRRYNVEESRTLCLWPLPRQGYMYRGRPYMLDLQIRFPSPAARLASVTSSMTSIHQRESTLPQLNPASFPAALQSVLILPQPNESGVPQMAVRRPLDVLKLPHQLGFQPPAFLHLLGG